MCSKSKKAWQKDQVYNQLEIYNYDVQNDVWSGPDVYFSSPRSHGTDHTKPFDSFWLDSIKFEVTGGVSQDQKFGFDSESIFIEGKNYSG